MNPLENFSFGGGAARTNLHPLVAGVMIVAIILILILPRRYVVVPLLSSMVLIPYGQEILVAGAHLFVFRILILTGWIRLLLTRNKPGEGKFAGGFTALDKLFFFWAIFRALAPILLFRQTGAVVNQAGFIWDAIGGYFLFRFLIRDDNDITRIIKTFATISFVIGIEMVREHFTGHDLFALVGGIRPALEYRNDVPRAMGPFAHALLAGTFGATLLPLFVWLWKQGGSKVITILGVIGCTLMASLTMCSSPVLAYTAGLGAICFWPFRNRMRTFRWGIVASCAALQVVMKAPFWFALGHIDFTGGSNGWYRAELIDTFLRHFRDWWLVGTVANVNWNNGAMWDQCNQFVTEGETGGLLTLVLFIGMIYICFRWLGKARKFSAGDRKEWFFWLLGATFFAHVVGFFGIDYFDQTRFVWYALLAMIAAAVAPILGAKEVREPAAAGVHSRPVPVWATVGSTARKLAGTRGKQDSRWNQGVASSRGARTGSRRFPDGFRFHKT